MRARQSRTAASVFMPGIMMTVISGAMMGSHRRRLGFFCPGIGLVWPMTCHTDHVSVGELPAGPTCHHQQEGGDSRKGDPPRDDGSDWITTPPQDADQRQNQNGAIADGVDPADTV